MNYKIILLLFIMQSCSQVESTAQKSKDMLENENDKEWLIKDLRNKWENNKIYTIAVLEAMPEKYYDFIPADEMRTFQNQAEHIIGNFSMLLGKNGFDGLSELKTDNKSSIIESYSKIFDEVLEYLDELDEKHLQGEVSMWYGQSSKFRILHLMDNHLAHHRGQMVVYLRLKGIKPPRYIGW